MFKSASNKVDSPYVVINNLLSCLDTRSGISLVPLLKHKDRSLNPVQAVVFCSEFSHDNLES